MSERFSDSSSVCTDGTEGGVSKENLKAQLVKYAKKLYRQIKFTNVKAKQSCPKKRRPTDAIIQYRQDLLSAISEVPDSIWD